MYVLVSEYVTKQHLIDLSPITTKSCRSTDLISEYESKQYLIDLFN
jgi:hypothetical protein